MSLKEALISLPVLALQRTKGRYTIDTKLVTNKWDVYSAKRKRMEVIALLATGPDHSMTMNIIGSNAQKVLESDMGSCAFAPVLVRNPSHYPNRTWDAPMDPYHSRGDWEAGAMACNVARI